MSKPAKYTVVVSRKISLDSLSRERFPRFLTIQRKRELGLRNSLSVAQVAKEMKAI